jgi:hypothetical protein
MSISGDPSAFSFQVRGLGRETTTWMSSISWLRQQYQLAIVA